MEKAFDTKVLVERLNAQGLPVLEDTIEKVVSEFFAWTEESLAIHPNALIKALGLPAVAAIKPFAFEQIDKIDGKEG